MIEEVKEQQPQTKTENRSVISEDKETGTGNEDVVDTSSIATEEVEKAKEQIKDTAKVPQETIQDEKGSNQTEKTKLVRSRKRTKSTASNKSVDETEQAQPQTPETRKRTQSTSSNKSEIEQKTPENVNVEVATPTSRRRSKTPSTEVRKILTRRASKELMEKGEDKSLIVCIEDVLTPRRRSTRSRSKKDDDNVSVASESSVKSSRSKVSEDGGDTKGPVRKGRKSIIQTKPDLSVIPEVTTEESKGETSEDIINELGPRR